MNVLADKPAAIIAGSFKALQRTLSLGIHVLEISALHYVLAVRARQIAQGVVPLQRLRIVRLPLQVHILMDLTLEIRNPNLRLGPLKEKQQSDENSHHFSLA